MSVSRRPAWIASFACFAAGLAVILSGSLPTAIGQQPKPLVVPVAPQSPNLTTPANIGAKPGSSVELTLTGTNLNDPTSVLLSAGGLIEIVKDTKPDPTKLKLKVSLPPKTP